MKYLYSFLLCTISSFLLSAQCNHSISVNSYSSVCNGNGTSTVTINITVLFGGGNNSAILAYNLNGNEVSVVTMLDNNGDIIDTDYIFDVPSCDNYDVILYANTSSNGNGSNCSDPAPIIVPVTLPVRFGDVRALAKDREILIKWQTFTEINNEKFLIQRSNDDNQFTTIGKVYSAGNSMSKLDYSFTDFHPNTGINFYRIKQVDLDGQISYSKVIKVVFESEASISIFPNPTTNYIEFSDFESCPCSIYSITGEFEMSLSPSMATERINIGHLNNGIHIVMDKNNLPIGKIVKQ